MDAGKLKELCEKVAGEKKMLIACISGVSGKEFEFALELSLDDPTPYEFLEMWLAPALAQVATELEYRFLGTSHDWMITPGELIPAE